MCQEIDKKLNDFVIFLLEEYKLKNNLSGKEAYDLFTKYDVFSYLEKNYELLHTLGKEYLLNDIKIYIQNRVLCQIVLVDNNF